MAKEKTYSYGGCEVGGGDCRDLYRLWTIYPEGLTLDNVSFERF